MRGYEESKPYLLTNNSINMLMLYNLLFIQIKHAIKNKVHEQ